MARVMLPLLGGLLYEKNMQSFFKHKPKLNMDLLKLEEFTEYFNSRQFEKCNQTIDQLVHYEERELGEGLRKIISSVIKIKAGNFGGANIPMEEGLKKLVPFRHLLEKHLPGFLRDLKDLQAKLKTGKTDLPTLKFRN